MERHTPKAAQESTYLTAPVHTRDEETLLRRLGVSRNELGELCSTLAIKRLEVLGAILERDLGEDENWRWWSSSRNSPKISHTS